MTDRHCGYIVTIENNLREDDAANTITALRQIKGVISVQPVVADVTEAIGQARAENDLKQKLIDTFFKPTKPAPYVPGT